MDFVETLLFDVNKQKDNWNRLLNKIRNASSIVIWGTGVAAGVVYDNLRKMKINISSFSDNDKKKWNTIFKGLKVVSPEEITKDSLIIICANFKYKIHQQLNEICGSNYTYIDPAYFYSESNEIVRKKIIQNFEKINQVYDFLADEHSKYVFRNILLHRAVYDIQRIWDVYDENQYFGNYIVEKIIGNFVDCGAFKGDTLQRYLKQLGNDNYQYFAVEADENNFRDLKEFCVNNHLTNVQCFNLGVWNESGEMHFSIGNYAESGKLENNGLNCKKVLLDTIDHIVSESAIDIITMDIEGSELKALEGAYQTIQKYKPILAISAYHQLEHLWEIPLMIKQINSEYNIYYGHHCWNMNDTVCYAKEG